MQRRKMCVVLIGSWLLGSQSDLDTCEASMDGVKGPGTVTTLYVDAACSAREFLMILCMMQIFHDTSLIFAHVSIMKSC